MEAQEADAEKIILSVRERLEELQVFANQIASIPGVFDKGNELSVGELEGGYQEAAKHKINDMSQYYSIAVKYIIKNRRQ